MPSINDRIGSQNVIRVLSNASAPPSRLLNLTDVESTSQADGNLLIWDASTSKFVMGRDLDGTEGYVFTGGTGNVGIVTFSGTTQSESTTTGAVIISGGLAVGKNVNFADGLNVVGIATFSNEVDINAAVDILRGLNVAGVTSVASLNIGATQVISSGRELQNIASLDATTTATIEAAIEVAPNTFTDLKISGVSTFIGIATYAAGIQVVSGVSTFDVAVDINAGLDVDGQTDLDEVVIAGVTTFNNADVVFQGAAAGQNITFDASENDLEFTDNARIKFGNNDDLEIWHDGTNSNIKNSTGDFHIRSDSLALKTADNSERYLKATKNQDVKLYYNGNEIFATTAEGVDVTGRTETDLLNVSGVSTLTGNVSFGTSAFFGDNDKINMGDGNDLQIYHASNGTGIIQNAGSGQLQLRSDTIRLLNQATDEDFAFFRDDGAVELYYNNTKRFETSGIGITVTGQLDSTTLNVSGVSTFSSAVDINAGLDVDGQLDADELVVAGVATFSSLIDANNRLDVVGGANLDQLNVTGVSTFTGSVALDSGADIPAGSSLDFGTDFSITRFSNQNKARIQYTGPGTFNFEIDDIDFRNSADNRTLMSLRDEGAVTLFHNNSAKLVTTTGGINVTGNTETDTLNVSGVATFTSAVDLNAGLDIDGQLDVDELVVAGVSTFSSLVDVNNRLDVVGGANLDQLNVVGVSTFNDDVRITAGGLDVVGVATFSTNVNVTGTLDAGLIDGGTY